MSLHQEIDSNIQDTDPAHINFTESEKQKVAAIGPVGQELSEYTTSQCLSEKEVWQRIRSGSLLAKCQNGKLMIYEQQSKKLITNKSKPTGKTKTPNLPPIPLENHKIILKNNEPAPYTSDNLSKQLPPEIGFFLDHLSIAKEENNEIIKLTQNSISQITQMAESVVDTKDKLINNQEKQIEFLEKDQLEKDKHISSLLQEIEDLKMLVETLSQKID